MYRVTQLMKCNRLPLQQRGMAAIYFEKFGAPADVCKSKALQASSPAAHEVTVSVKAAEITISDIKLIRGLSLNAKSAGVAGITSIGSVTAVGSGVSSISLKDSVFVVGSGAWSDSTTVSASSTFKIPDISVDEASSLTSAVTAYALLKNFIGLKPGDVVLQDNGTSAVGQAITQLGKVFGVKVISASVTELQDSKYPGSLGGVKLAISSGNDSNSRNMIRSLAPGGAFVVYDGSLNSLAATTGVAVPVAATIFKDVSVSGFDLSVWASSSPAQVQEAVAAIAGLIKSKAITLAPKVFVSSEFLAALKAVETSGSAAVLKI